MIQHLSRQCGVKLGLNVLTLPCELEGCDFSVCRKDHGKLCTRPPLRTLNYRFERTTALAARRFECDVCGNSIEMAMTELAVANCKLQFEIAWPHESRSES